MNKTLKWILIGLAIALGVFLVALPIFFLARNAGNLAQGFGYRMPMMRAPYGMHFGRGLFGGVFMLFRGLFVLGLIGLAVFGVVALVRRNRTPMTPPPMPPAQPAQSAQNASAVLPASDTRVCINCGKPLSVEGEYCPHCGTKQ